jgi:hypothetical protein
VIRGIDHLVIAVPDLEFYRESPDHRPITAGGGRCRRGGLVD